MMDVMHGEVVILKKEMERVQKQVTKVRSTLLT